MNDNAKSPWQLSLATLLLFVFAVALWFLVVARAPLNPIIPLFVMLSGMAATLFLWRRKKKALLVLLILFETIVVGTTVAQTLARAASSRDYGAKQSTLRAIAAGLSSYFSSNKGVPPPPADAKLHSKLLHGILPLDVPTPSGKILGATDNYLKWEPCGADRFILIDMGEDGLAGKYTYDGTSLRRTPVDSNHDGIDDGADDQAVTQTWERLP